MIRQKWFAKHKVRKMWKAERVTQSINSSTEKQEEHRRQIYTSERSTPSLISAQRLAVCINTQVRGPFWDVMLDLGCVGMEELDFLNSSVPSSALLGTVTASFFCLETLLEMTLPLAQNTERPHCYEATLQPNYMRGRFFISIPKISLLHVR